MSSKKKRDPEIVAIGRMLGILKLFPVKDASRILWYLGEWNNDPQNGDGQMITIERPGDEEITAIGQCMAILSAFPKLQADRILRYTMAWNNDRRKLSSILDRDSTTGE